MTETEQTVHVAQKKRPMPFECTHQFQEPDFWLMWPWIPKLYQHQPVELVDTTRKCIHQYWLTLAQRNIQFSSQPTTCFASPPFKRWKWSSPPAGTWSLHGTSRCIWWRSWSSLQACKLVRCTPGTSPSSIGTACADDNPMACIPIWKEKPLMMRLSSWDLAEDLLHLDSFFHELTW